MMKGGGGGFAPAKRRWKGLVIGVLFLVVLSMFVPLGFLLGLHNGFPSSGFVPAQHSSPSNVLRDYDRYSTNTFRNRYQDHHSSHIDELVKKLAPALPKEILGDFVNEAKNVTLNANATSHSQVIEDTPVPHLVVLQPVVSENHPTIDGGGRVTESVKGGADESGNLCEIKFGSYCLWREENREEMKDSMVKELKDQLFVARAYFPSIAKIPAQNKLSRELKQNIQEFERVLSESTTDADLPFQIENKVRKMEAVISRAKSVSVDCNNVDKKLRQIFDMTEDEANFHMKQSAFLYQLTVQTMPKSLHCLSMRLTVEYFKARFLDEELSNKYMDPSLQHYVIFSKNVLASSVAINSTVMHARDSANQVFHVLTDRENYYAMKFWFFKNTYKNAVVQVLNIEQVNVDYRDNVTQPHLSLPMEFRVSFHGDANTTVVESRTQYVSLFSHSHYFLPVIFKNLQRVVVLDDDVIVQKDLSELWNLNMGGKVNGAVQLCSVRLGQLSGLLGQSNFDKNSCIWMTGLNVIDLDKWRELGVTETYFRLVKQQMGSEESSGLRASLLTFHDQIHSLDGLWTLSGLGHDYGLDTQIVERAALLHYNGNMKPWLELGIPKYKVYWKKFLKQGDQFMRECNVNS